MKVRASNLSSSAGLDYQNAKPSLRRWLAANKPANNRTVDTHGKAVPLLVPLPFELSNFCALNVDRVGMIIWLRIHPVKVLTMSDIDPELIPTAQLLERALLAEQMPPRRWLCRYGELDWITGVPKLAKRYKALRCAKLAMMTGRLI